MIERQVFVSGTWNAKKAEPYREQATLLGGLIAAADFGLACGPGTGIARHVIDGFRSYEGGRGKVRYYLPREECMTAVGEKVEPGADDVVVTEFDYPVRNVFQIGQCAGLFCITGGDGTLEEILPAVIDYELPVSIIRGSGSAAEATDALLKVYPQWRNLITLGDSVDALFPDWIAKVRERFGGRH
ncbi:MAG: SLOG cluster 4 domain-containing protein [Actinomycetota bacterium]